MEHPLQALINWLHKNISNRLVRWLLVLMVFCVGLLAAAPDWMRIPDQMR